ncbi:hypothetical protein N7474_007802 [Penicillium riverlandense]|uniref:uncharacterized protein n=1 Tax=Penicillium riverlandense TaxID=1903569 RepID=UPI002548C2EA|nr:uncharacterized protein N7474_007802 [Penicillium riverlandense]KAJ5811501.1 hypothetical protein N7474_007802 [Penicillium riverlandense]
MRNNFTEAICHSQYFNKTEFQLATPIKEYFAGVGEGVVTDERYGSDPKHLRYYKSVPHLPRLTKPPTKPAEYYSTPAYNDPNLLREMDAQGKLISCMKCGRGTGGERPIISCDYCPCRFHLDCLDPPRAIPTNPYVGWMCPNHVTPDDMIAIKEQEDGGEHVRRVRRPKNMRSIDVDVSFSDDPEKTLFDDEWRERRARLPAGDLILQFIDTVKLDRSRREKEHMLHVERQCMSMARIITMEYYRRLGIDDPAQVVSEHGVSSEIADGISTVVKQSMDGKTPDHEAATVLLALAHTGPTSSTTTGADGNAEASQPTDSHQDAPTSSNAAVSSHAKEPNSKSDEGITIGSSQNATSSEAPQASEPTTAPPLTFDDSASESSGPDPLPKVPNLPGFNSKASRGRKRYLTETETLATEEEPAQKRQHVGSAPKEQRSRTHAGVDADGDSDIQAARPNDAVIVNDEDKDAPTWGSNDKERLQSAEQLENEQIVKDLKDRLKGVDTMLREGQTDPETQIGLLDEIEGLSKALRGRIGGQSQATNQHAQPAEQADGEKEL